MVCVCRNFATSVYFGLEKGMKRLSSANVWLSFLLLAFLLLAGPMVFILKASLSGLGTVLQNFIKSIPGQTLLQNLILLKTGLFFIGLGGSPSVYLLVIFHYTNNFQVIGM